MRIGDFVTGKLLKEDDVRQGIVLAQDDSAIVIKGESGAMYFLDPRETNTVPDENLWGSTKDFVMDWRKKNGIGER